MDVVIPVLMPIIERYLLIFSFKSVYNSFNLSTSKSKADFVTESALSLASMWLGIHYIRTSLQLKMESSVSTQMVVLFRVPPIGKIDIFKDYSY